MGARTTTRFGDRRWSFASAGAGAAVWLGAPWLPLRSSPSFGSLEHVFVFLPLVAAPLALLLLSSLLRPEGGATPLLHVAAMRIQPAAAAMVLGSFFVAKGALAGVLTAGWLVMAVLVTIGGIGLVRRGVGAHLSNVSLAAAHVFLPMGAVWLLLSRLGVGPRSFPALTVLLAALHFHFSGFTLQILMAATGLRLRSSAARLGAVHRCGAIGAIAGIPLLAAGNALASPVLKFAGVASMVLGALALAVTSAAVALELGSPMPRGLLLVSAASIAAGMVVAGVYGAGELSGNAWIGIPGMVKVHGLLNALGFTLCGLSAHVQAPCLARAP